MSDISDAIGSALGTTLQNTVGQVLYWIVAGVSWVISIVYQLFEVLSGQIKVSYKGEANFLTNIFFENTTIAGVYWGMAMIGVVLCFAFTIVAVIRKMFDSADRMQTSMGAILGGTLKSILLILSMNAVMVMTLNVCNVLMQQVVYVFNAGSSLTEEQSIYLENYGHIGQIDQILSLELALKEGKVKAGSTVCMIAAGIGYTWAANVIQWG